LRHRITQSHAARGGFEGLHHLQHTEVTALT
jgi:hypothetical protein